jgi:hypothetical protein
MDSGDHAAGAARGQISVVTSEREERREREGSGWLPGDASRERSAFEFRLIRSCDGDP